VLRQPSQCFRRPFKAMAAAPQAFEVAARSPILFVRIAPEAGLAPDVLTTHICSL
jgi:hypothetical protein